MRVRVQKQGDDLVVRIPADVAAAVGIREGSMVDVVASEGRTELRPSDRRLRLADLLEGVTPDRIHGEVDFGPPIGREVW